MPLQPNLAFMHPAAGKTLLEYAFNGCPVEAGRDWTQNELKAAIEYGSHPMDKEATLQPLKNRNED